MNTRDFIQINASDAAKFSGHNTFCSETEVIEAFWRCNTKLATKFNVAIKPGAKSSVERAIHSFQAHDKVTICHGLNLPSDATPEQISQTIHKQIVRVATDAPTNRESSASVAQSAAAVLEKGSASTNHTIPAQIALRFSTAIEEDSQKHRGTIREASSINAFEKECGKAVVNRNTKCLQKIVLEELPMPVLLTGKVDGTFAESGEVVEIKERRRRLFGRVVNYEKVQLHCYMYLTDTKRCLLRERFDSTTMEHWIEFDEQFWNDCLSSIQNFVTTQLVDNDILSRLTPSRPFPPDDGDDSDQSFNDPELRTADLIEDRATEEKRRWLGKKKY